MDYWVLKDEPSSIFLQPVIAGEGVAVLEWSHLAPDSSYIMSKTPQGSPLTLSAYFSQCRVFIAVCLSVLCDQSAHLSACSAWTWLHLHPILVSRPLIVLFLPVGSTYRLEKSFMKLLKMFWKYLPCDNIDRLYLDHKTKTGTKQLSCVEFYDRKWPNAYRDLWMNYVKQP